MTVELSAGDWVGCLVLTIAPGPRMAEVVVAVLRAETAISGDPVFSDVARVAASRMADRLAGTADDLARGLYRELVDWSLAVRSVAPRFTFGLLVLNTDPAQADRLIRQLASDATLSRLPIAFRVGELPRSTPETVADPGTTFDGAAALSRMIVDAVHATAAEVEQSAGFSLDVATLATLAAGRAYPVAHRGEPAGIDSLAAEVPAAPSGPVAIDPDPDGPVVPEPAVIEEVAVPTLVHLAAPSPSGGEPAPVSVPGRFDPRPALGRLIDSTRTLLSTPRLPSSTVEVIDRLSQRADQVKVLYIVLVSEPVAPSRRVRERRAAVAMGVARRVMVQPGPGAEESWFVRAFSADQRLRPAGPLPEPERLRRKDFPERWGEYVDLFDCLGDIQETMDRDAASFVRRGHTADPRTVLVFLSGEPPSGGPDAVQRYAELCARAGAVWITFGGAALPDAFRIERSNMIIDHDDVIDEVVAIVASLAEPIPDDAPTAELPAGFDDDLHGVGNAASSGFVS